MSINTQSFKVSLPIESDNNSSQVSNYVHSEEDIKRALDAIAVLNQVVVEHATGEDKMQLKSEDYWWKRDFLSIQNNKFGQS